MRRVWQIVMGRMTVSVVLLVAAAVSVGLACAGADGALEAMKYYAAIGAVAGVARREGIDTERTSPT